MTYTPSTEDMVAVLRTLVNIFDKSRLAYCIGGSFASSIHGEFRATNDIDILAIFSDESFESFILNIKKGFSFEEGTLRTAVSGKKSFSLIHLDSMVKIDFYPRGEAFEMEQIKRAIAVKIPNSDLAIKVSTPEDILLAKLRWFQLGGQVSDRQWRDIEGIVRVQGSRLDQGYLEKWSRALGVEELLKTCQTLRKI